jgi:hypothetical protein
MTAPKSSPLSVRYTTVSDRFRSLWTFYQFLAGVMKHLNDGPVPYSYDFQGLHRRIKEMVHTIGQQNQAEQLPDLDQVERELDRIHRDLARIESGYPPSVMRRFFDHIKRQDEKVLNALLKFYLQSPQFTQDTLDKLDILFTRLAEVPLDEGRVTTKDPDDLVMSFERLFQFTHLGALPAAEVNPLVEAVVAVRSELETIEDYPPLVQSKIYDRYRTLKQRMGPSILNPPILVQVVLTNIAAKNRFEELFRAEESKVADNTNRIYEIERYLESHPELARPELRSQLEEFRHSRLRYESSLKKGNVKRDEITDMTRAMHKVLAQFDPTAKPSPVAPSKSNTAQLKATPPRAESASEDEAQGASLAEVLPLDPLLKETLHKIMFALEMVVWDRLPTQAAEAPEIRNLELEPWEVDIYRRLAEGSVERGSAEWDLDVFFLSSAALRVKMDDEHQEIERLQQGETQDRLFEVLERSAQSLERARDADRRFQWFIDDMLFRGETNRLDDIYRSRFRFLHAYSGLWLVHQGAGGLTPL